MDALIHRGAQKVAHYLATIRLNNWTFSPFVVSADGLLAPKAQEVLNTIVRRLSVKILGS